MGAEAVIYAVCFSQPGITAVTAMFWESAVGDASLVLYAAAFASAGTAMSMQIIVLPWLARWYNPDLIPALMFGNNLGSNLGAITGLIQKPGDDEPVFGYVC